MKHARVFLLGMAAATAVLFLAGAVQVGEAGRYQIAAYAASTTHGVYVLDTRTGLVKVVSYGKGANEYPSQVGAPFEKMGNMPKARKDRDI